MAEIRQVPTMLRLTYVLARVEPEREGQRKLRLVERHIRKLWRDQGQYKLNIETAFERAGESQ